MSRNNSNTADKVEKVDGRQAQDSRLRRPVRVQRTGRGFGRQVGKVFGFGVLALHMAFSAGTVYAQGAGKALDFDGTGDYVDISAVSSLDFSTSSFTVEWWMEYPITQSGSFAGIIADQYWNSSAVKTNWWGIVQSSSTGGLKYYDEATGNASFDNNVTIDSSIPNGWHHFVFVRDAVNNRFKFYRDSNNVYDNLYSNEVNLVSHGLYIAMVESRYTGGTVDEVRIWNVARTEEQIRDNMCKKLAGTEDGLVGYWRLDESSGTSCEDSSPNTNTGTVLWGSRNC